MHYRELGRTGLQISAIVFGAGAVGGAVFRPDRATRIETVRRALAGGVNWIDTAPSYGDGRSEENLGWILRELNARPYLSTKVRLEPNELRDVRGAVHRSLERSLMRLDRDRVDLIQLHNRVAMKRDPESGTLSVDDVLRTGGIADAFGRLRDESLVGFSGFSALGEVDALHELVASRRFHTAQVYHNLLNPSASRPVGPGFSAEDYRDLIGAAVAHGVGVLNIRVLAAGVIAGVDRSGGQALSPGSDATADARRLAAVEAALADQSGSMAQKALRFALHTPGVAGVLIGFSSPEQVDQALAAAEMPVLGKRALERLDDLYRSDFAPA